VTDFGGMGGLKGGRPLNPDDLFEAAVDRTMGERLRAEGIGPGGFGAYNDTSLAARLWGSLANVDWKHEGGDTASYSFRAAGDLVAAVIGDGDYMDWYCSAPDGNPDAEVCAFMAAEGWSPTEEVE
jgi:hypothetical protein